MDGVPISPLAAAVVTWGGDHMAASMPYPCCPLGRLVEMLACSSQKKEEKSGPAGAGGVFDLCDVVLRVSSMRVFGRPFFPPPRSRVVDRVVLCCAVLVFRESRGLLRQRRQRTTWRRPRAGRELRWAVLCRHRVVSVVVVVFECCVGASASIRNKRLQVEAWEVSCSRKCLNVRKPASPSFLYSCRSLVFTFLPCSASVPGRSRVMYHK